MEMMEHLVAVERLGLLVRRVRQEAQALLEHLDHQGQVVVQELLEFLEQAVQVAHRVRQDLAELQV
jgi:hypothetical protein